KPMLPLAGKPIIGHVIERLSDVPGVDVPVVATTRAGYDDPLAMHVAWNTDAYVYRGSEDDVLARNYEAALSVNADVVLQVGADDVLTDPALAARVVAAILRPDTTDYVETRYMPLGVGCRAFTVGILGQAVREATLPLEREHITGFWDKRPKRFPPTGVYYGETDQYLAHRLTVDTWADYELHQHIFDHLYPQNPRFTLEDVMALLAEHPEWEEPVRGTPHLQPSRTPVDGTKFVRTRYGDVPDVGVNTYGLADAR